MWKKRLEQIEPLSERWMEAAKDRVDNLVKPKGSLGLLEDMAVRAVAIREEERPSFGKKKVVVFAGDHGVAAEENISIFPQEVTGLMVRNFIDGVAAINVISRSAGADVDVVDIGMKETPGDLQGLIRKNVRRGTDNMARGPAMSVEDAQRAINVGIEMADNASDQGFPLIATGEMGIGNTTPSAALFSALLPAAVSDVTGRGTGIDDDTLSHKINVIKKALEINKSRVKDPLSALAALGGMEIAGICGLCIGGAARKMVVVVDGFIASAGALVAMKLNPHVKKYLFFAHCSQEIGHKVFFEKEGIRPVLDFDMRLGEGTGACLVMQVIEHAVKIYNEMATFEDVGIEPGN